MQVLQDRLSWVLYNLALKVRGEVINFDFENFLHYRYSKSSAVTTQSDSFESSIKASSSVLSFKKLKFNEV